MNTHTIIPTLPCVVYIVGNRLNVYIHDVVNCPINKMVEGFGDRIVDITAGILDCISALEYGAVNVLLHDSDRGRLALISRVPFHWYGDRIPISMIWEGRRGRPLVVSDDVVSCFLNQLTMLADSGHTYIERSANTLNIGRLQLNYTSESMRQMKYLEARKIHHVEFDNSYVSILGAIHTPKGISFYPSIAKDLYNLCKN